MKNWKTNRIFFRFYNIRISLFERGKVALKVPAKYFFFATKNMLKNKFIFYKYLEKVCTPAGKTPGGAYDSNSVPNLL